MTSPGKTPVPPVSPQDGSPRSGGEDARVPGRTGEVSGKMRDMSKHAAPEAIPKSASPVPAAWVVLFTMGGASVIFQVYHATNFGHMNPFLAVIYGLSPVAASMGLSHVAALHKAGWAMQVLTYLAMAAAMLMSIGAIADVIAPTAGPELRWVFGGVLDGAALIALRVILVEHERDAARAVAAEKARREAEAAAEARAAAAAESAAASSPASPRGSSPRRKPAPSPRKRREASPSVVDPDLAQLDTWAAALSLVDREPEISGNELGRRLGKSERYGRDLLRRIKSEGPVTGPMSAVRETAE